MNETVARYDAWIEESGPAALVMRQFLQPVDGPDGVFFPATFAPSEDKKFQGGYNIDYFSDGTNVCLVDSVGSQANRVEPIFMKEPYASLVPQVFIVAGEKRVNLLEAGHRAGDAIVRFSSLANELEEAFIALLKGNAVPLAKIAPTSLIFGVWDSRKTQAKVPRLFASVIYAFNVNRLTRSAQYFPPVDYVAEKLLEEADEKDKTLAELGFVHQPATGTHGGLIAKGGIRRDVVLHLASLRTLCADSPEATRKLRRYLLGLALVAFTYPLTPYLRQGCNLVLDPTKKPEVYAVYPDGKREDINISHAEATEFARSAAKEFGVGAGREAKFLPEEAKKAIGEKKQRAKKKGGRSEEQS